MDMFRHYHNEITGSMESIADKDFAHVTNQTSYEIYYLVQEVILRLFPGTSVIVTGTMKDLSWVKICLYSIIRFTFFMKKKIGLA